MQVFVSCGHNNARNTLVSPRDNGATSKGTDWSILYEYTYARRVARKIAESWLHKSVLVVVVPEWLNLSQRIKYINNRAKDGDICIELHMNAGAVGATGSETFYFAWSNYARRKAEIFQAEFARLSSIKTRGVKPDTATRFGRLGFIRDTKPLALLLEMGFIGNPTDRDNVWLKWHTAFISALSLIAPL
jgi:N-acetylmuramoyl-L-alanine amidase